MRAPLNADPTQPHDDDAHSECRVHATQGALQQVQTVAFVPCPGALHLSIDEHMLSSEQGVPPKLTGQAPHVDDSLVFSDASITAADAPVGGVNLEWSKHADGCCPSDSTWHLHASEVAVVTHKEHHDGSARTMSAFTEAGVVSASTLAELSWTPGRRRKQVIALVDTRLTSFAKVEKRRPLVATSVTCSWFFVEAPEAVAIPYVSAANDTMSSATSGSTMDVEGTTPRVSSRIVKFCARQVTTGGSFTATTVRGTCRSVERDSPVA